MRWCRLCCSLGAHRARRADEAVLWHGHGGEVEPSREAFRALLAADRASVLVFVGSL
ncbi:di-heme oxidoredictase family protein [Sorangium sp. So ce1014]|uniref:di-heme oxidoredictase family protein n=1 Tax=Sorangium sp. So ce1014 TaxID=3133326 RepID=UPI003F5D5EB7